MKEDRDIFPYTGSHGPGSNPKQTTKTKQQQQNLGQFEEWYKGSEKKKVSCWHGV